MKNKGLYVHIPFCGAICHYCDFTKFIYHAEWIKPYLKELKHDLSFFNVQKDLKTIYIGGGTPTRLSFSELKKLLKLLLPYSREVQEYTVEANIESLTLPKLKLLREYGVNRLSIGVQSTDDAQLEALNRKHTYSQIKSKIRLVKKAGFTNFSVDLIYGLPGQTEKDLKLDLKRILALDPPHISTYALTIEPNTVSFIRSWPEVSNEVSRAYYDLILKTLRKSGYNRYEVSNFAKTGAESEHNKLYWHNQNYYGIGLGASGYLGNKRYKIAGGLTKYLKGEARIEEELISKEMFIEEYFMLNLRLSSGFLISDFEARTNVNFAMNYGKKVDKLIKRGLVNRDETRVYPTDEGIMLLDSVVLDLIM